VKYNFKSFNAEFPDDAACLEYIFKSRFPEQKCECGKSNCFHRRTTRRCYTIEGFWSQLKRSIIGTHHSVSRKHLQKFRDKETHAKAYYAK
jgi:hypothetical protein